MDTGEATTTRRWGVTTAVVIGAAAGALVGAVFGLDPILGGPTTEDLGRASMLIIRLLKALAAPLVGVAILDGLVRQPVTGRGVRALFAICAVNVAVAMVIGLTIMNTAQPGLRWQGQLDVMAGDVSPEAAEKLRAGGKGATLDLLANLDAHVPKSVVAPLLENDILGIVLVAVLGGLALRRARAAAAGDAEASAGLDGLARGITAVYDLLKQMLVMIIWLVPLVIFGAVASSVGRFGLGVFGHLSLFLGVILGGMALHALVYYPLVAWAVGRKRPGLYLGKGGRAVVTGLATNSSLATVPVTLDVLTKDLGVSERSARLSACIGTNLNNDGITLYEAMAALFLAQAAGFGLGLDQQLQVVAASILAGIGVAGIPEAGLIMLPLVLSAAGLGEAAIALWLPVILGVDWIIARVRSGVNVMSDLLVAILLDRFDPPG